MAKNKRLWVLIALAVILAGAFFIDQRGGLDALLGPNLIATAESMPGVIAANSVSVVSGDTIGALYQKRDRLLKFKAEEEAINNAYFKVAPVYADHVVELAGLITDPGIEDRKAAEDAIRNRLEQSGVIDNIRISIAESEKLSSGVRKTLAEVSFTTQSSQDAQALLFDLGSAKNGFIWKNLTMTTDRMRKEVSMNGRIEVLLAEAAE